MKPAARLAERLLPLLAAARQPGAANTPGSAAPLDADFLAARGPERWLALTGASRAATTGLAQALADDDAAALDAALDALVASVGDWLALHAELSQAETADAGLAEGRRLALAVVAHALSDLALWLARVLADLERRPPVPLPPLRLRAQAEVLRWAAWSLRRRAENTPAAAAAGAAVPAHGWLNRITGWLTGRF